MSCCISCGNNFPLRKKGPGRPKKFCSEECKKTTKPVRKVVCAVCGKIFLPRGSRSKYCSPECLTKGFLAAIERQRQRREKARLKGGKQ